jgi:glycosyltransferase involved in cell wall biosynthesis
MKDEYRMRAAPRGSSQENIIIIETDTHSGMTDDMRSVGGNFNQTTSSDDDVIGPRIFYYGPAHPTHESMYLEPPKGVRFSANRDPSIFEGFSTPPVYQPMRRLGVNMVGRFFQSIGSPRRVPVLARCDLVHVDGAAVPITNRPWMIGNIEYASAIFSFDDTWYTRPTMRNTLVRLLAGPKCRRILTLSEASLDSLKLGLGKDFGSIAAKTGVLPPAVPSKYLLRNPPKRDDGEPTKILFVGNHFFDKGGRELFYAYRRMRQRFDVNLVYVTGAPKHHESYFNSFAEILRKEPGVTLYSRIPRDFLWKECFAKSDIFCMPSYMDTFGYAVLEAMANRLPIVTTDMFALAEIVKNEETGLLVHAPITSFERDRLRTPESVARYRAAVLDERLFSPIVDSLEASLVKLMENGSLRKRMGETAFKEVETGRFSVSYRNKHLYDWYREALQ